MTVQEQIKQEVQYEINRPELFSHKIAEKRAEYDLGERAISDLIKTAIGIASGVWQDKGLNYVALAELKELNNRISGKIMTSEGFPIKAGTMIAYA